MLRTENIQQKIPYLEKQSESLFFIRSDINKIILKWIEKNAEKQGGFLGSFLHSSSKEQHDQLIGFYKAVNLVSYNNSPLCDRTFLMLCREKMNSVDISGDLKMALNAVLKTSEATLAMRDKLLLLVAGVTAGFLGSQSTIFTVFILGVLALLYKDVTKIGMVFDFVCKLGDRLDSFANQTVHQSASSNGISK